MGHRAWAGYFLSLPGLCRPGRRCAGRVQPERPRPGSRPASASARRSRNSIWALVLHSSSPAHRARAPWTAGSSRSRTLLRSVTAVQYLLSLAEGAGECRTPADGGHAGGCTVRMHWLPDAQQGNVADQAAHEHDAYRSDLHASAHDRRGPHHHADRRSVIAVRVTVSHAPRLLPGLRLAAAGQAESASWQSVAYRAAPARYAATM